MDELRILYLGDLVGKAALRALYTGLSSLKKKYNAHLIAVNGENLEDGHGMVPDDVKALLSMGVGLISTGNHIWQKKESFPLLDTESRLLRPVNYPAGTPGHGTALIEAAGVRVGFINVQGQIRMGMTLDCPYKASRKAVNELKKQAKCILIDFHAEDVREKEGMFYYMDGLVSAVLGTHTHVPTADERIMPKGTAVVSDLGMCGAKNSVLGVLPELSIRRACTHLPIRLEVMDGPVEIQGMFLRLDPGTGKALSIERIRCNA